MLPRLVRVYDGVISPFSSSFFGPGNGSPSATNVVFRLVSVLLLGVVVFTPPTRLNSTVASRRRRRCVLGLVSAAVMQTGREILVPP